MVHAPEQPSSYYARNAGAAVASGEWLLFIDADCVPAPDLLDRYFAEPIGERCGAVAGGIVGVADQDSLLARYARDRNFLDQAEGMHGSAGVAAATGNLLVRRRTFDELGGFADGIRSAGDVDFCWRMRDAGWTLEQRPRRAGRAPPPRGPGLVPGDDRPLRRRLPVAQRAPPGRRPALAAARRARGSARDVAAHLLRAGSSRPRSGRSTGSAWSPTTSATGEQRGRVTRGSVRRVRHHTAPMDEIEVGRIILLWLWCFGLACIEIEIEGGYGWAQRLPTWWLGRGLVGRIYGLVMGHRPLTGYHVFAFTIPLLILHFPYVMGVDWTLAGELRTIGTFFALAVFWDYMWFVFNPAYTVARFKRGNVWWFEVPWIWRFPLDYYIGIGLSIGFAALAGPRRRRHRAARAASSGCSPGSRC